MTKSKETVFAEVMALTKLEREEGESATSLNARVVQAINELPDDDYDRMSPDAQAWFKEVCAANKTKKPLPLAPGLDADESADEETVKEKTAPAKSKAPAAAKSSPAKTKTEKTKAEPKARASKGVTIEPAKEATACRAGTKTAQLIDLLFRKEGATAAQIQEEMSKEGKPWSSSSVMSGLYWDVKKKGYGVKTEIDGETHTYHLVLPAGLKAPVPHSTATPTPPTKAKAEPASEKAPAAKGAKAAATTKKSKAA